MLKITGGEFKITDTLASFLGILIQVFWARAQVADGFLVFQKILTRSWVEECSRRQFW